MFTTSRKPFTGLVSIGAWIATSGANTLLKLSWLAPASMAMRNGCLDMSVLLAWRRQLTSTELRQMQQSSGDLVPHVGRAVFRRSTRLELPFLLLDAQG